MDRDNNKNVLRVVFNVIKSNQLLYIIGLLVCLCNAVFIFDNAIWGDEAFSLILVRENVRELLFKTATDVHPPLYYLILKPFINIIGESVLLAHLVSYLTFIGTNILAMTFVRNNFGLISAYLMLFFTGWTECGMIYSVEIRMYSMALFFITLTFCVAYKVIYNGDMKYWIALAGFALLAGYTHYFALISVAFMMLGVFLLCILKRQEDIYKKIGITTIGCVVGYIPWLIAMVTTVKRTMGNFWLSSIPTFRECSNMFMGNENYSDKLFILLILLVIAYLCLNIYDIMYGKVSVKEKHNVIVEQDALVQVAILGIWTFMGTTLFGIFVSIYIRPILLTRYLFPMVTLGAISLGILIHYFIKRPPIGGIVMILTFVLILNIARDGVEAYQDRYQIFDERRQNTNASLEVINRYVEQEYIIVSNVEHFKWTVLEYYYPEKWGKEHIKDNVILLWEEPLSVEEIKEWESEGFSIDFQEQGQIDISKYYMYILMKE